jgi:hypothetical protein
VPTQSFGSASALEIDGSPSVRFALIRPASLSAIPSGSRVIKAELVVEVSDGGNSFSVHRVLDAWSESTTRYENAPPTSSAFATASGSVGTRAIDVTSIVQDWVDGDTAHGIALRPTGTNGVDLYSSEHGTSAQRPYFRVTVER